jgi:hypothetical protein
VTTDLPLACASSLLTPPRAPTVRDSPPPGEGEFNHSRGASEHPSYGNPLTETVTTDLIRCSMPSCSRQMPVEAFASTASARMTKRTNGQELKENVGGETPTDARLFCRGCGHGRACKRQAHIYRRSTAVLVPRSLSSQGTQHQAFASWDPACPLSGRYPPLPIPVQRADRASVVVPRG